jgi:hypothetical protein
MREKKNAYKILVGELEEMRLLEKAECRWQV